MLESELLRLKEMIEHEQTGLEATHTLAQEAPQKTLDQINKNGVELPHNKVLTASENKLLINGKDLLVKGDKGDTGPEGAQGLKGEPGEDGKPGFYAGKNIESIAIGTSEVNVRAKKSLLHFEDWNRGSKNWHSSYTLLTQRVKAKGRPFLIFVNTSTLTIEDDFSRIECHLYLNGGYLNDETMEVRRSTRDGHKFNISYIYTPKPGDYEFKIEMKKNGGARFYTPSYQAYVVEL